MSEIERSARGGSVATQTLNGPEHSHPPSESCPDSVDAHASWLKEWRSLRSEVGGHKRASITGAAIGELQDKIAHTPALTLVGLQAQAELISELAWNDVVAATARQLLKGIKRLQQKKS